MKRIKPAGQQKNSLESPAENQISFLPRQTGLVRELERRITNQDMRYQARCTFRRGGAGLEDFAFIARHLDLIENWELLHLLDLIEELLGGHKCSLCRVKMLAFCEIFTRDRLPGRHLGYQKRFERLNAWLLDSSRHAKRDFRQEVRDAIAHGNRALRPNIGWPFRAQSGQS